MAHWTTTGVQDGPLCTRRIPGETLRESMRRHAELVAESLPEGNRLVTTWQLPGRQDGVVTTRRAGESDEDVRRRHLGELPLG